MFYTKLIIVVLITGVKCMTTITEVGRGLIEVQALKISYILWEEILFEGRLAYVKDIQ